MKKYILAAVIAVFFAGFFPLFALTYDNNEFQKKSRAYTDLATQAYDAGEYDEAVNYAKLAEQNAALSEAFIKNMLVRADTQDSLFKAHTRLTWAKGIKADKYFPDVFVKATDSVATADTLFAKEDYPGAKQNAEQALNTLSVVREITPLPAFYRILPWMSSKDCFWNIAANPAVYGNPFLWSELYKANKGALKRPADPNLLMPGMIVTIPSLKGEYREGTYNPSIKYDSYKSQIKK
jgi:nucleoid-associated protein YgaU